jgi:hypothetical protein
VYQTQQSIKSSLDVDIVLTNLTGKTFDIQKVRIFLPEPLRELRPHIKEDLEFNAYPLGPQSQRLHRLRVPSVEPSLGQLVFDRRTLFFLPGDYVVRVEVEFKPAAGFLQSTYATHNVTLAAPLNSLLRGAVLGAILLAIFVPTYRRLRASNRQRRSWKDLLGQGLMFLISGSVVGVTAILLLQRMGDLALPVTVAVNDWLGGIVIGLFSYKIGDVLYKQLFEDEGATEDEGAPGDEGTPEEAS